MKIQRKRSAAKALTWGCLSTCLLVGLSVVTHAQTSFTFLICLDVATKIVAFYLHDRAWSLSRFGIKPARIYLCPSGRDQFTTKHL